jgi:hypothetical protein
MVNAPGQFAQIRAKDIKRLLARLKAGDAIPELCLPVANTREAEARRRAVELHLAAAERYLQTARLHDRAAAMYEEAASGKNGEQAHLQALDHEAAAARNRHSAISELGRAGELAYPPYPPYPPPL